MSDRIVEAAPTAAPEMPEVLSSVLLFLINESREMLESGEGIVSRTGLVMADTLVEEEADSDTVEGCYAKAAHTVRDAAGARAYGFVYDGEIEVDTGTIDAIIAEGGVPGGEAGYAVGLVYTIGEDGTFAFEDDPIYIGHAPNFMANLRQHAIETPEEVSGQSETADEGEASNIIVLDEAVFAEKEETASKGDAE